MPLTQVPQFTEEFLTEAALGNVPGYSIVNKNGRNPNGTNGTEETVSLLGEMQLPSSASTMRISAGGNANDTAAGSGAREVTIYGLDSSGELAEEAIATNGASASSATTTSFLRVFRARVTKSGTYVATGTSTSGSNQGAVVIEDSSGTNDYIQIDQFEGSSQFGGYTVPTDKTGYLIGGSVDIDASKSADVILYLRGGITTTTAPVESRIVIEHLDGVSGKVPFSAAAPIDLGSGSDFWVTFIPTANGTECAVDFQLLLVDN
jgi:hypothetical protein